MNFGKHLDDLVWDTIQTFFVFEGSNSKLEEKSYLLCETVNYLHAVRSPNTKNKHIMKWVYKWRLVVTHPEKITHRVRVVLFSSAKSLALIFKELELLNWTSS